MYDSWLLWAEPLGNYTFLHGPFFSWYLDTPIFILCRLSTFSFFCLSRTEIVRSGEDTFSICFYGSMPGFPLHTKNWSLGHLFPPSQVLVPYTPECHMVGGDEKKYLQQMGVGLKTSAAHFSEGSSSSTANTLLSGQLLGYKKMPL